MAPAVAYLRNYHYLECHAFLIHKLQDIDPKLGYQEFKRKRGTDPRFEALDRKEREALFKEK
jgi:hypothetical protein